MSLDAAYSTYFSDLQLLTDDGSIKSYRLNVCDQMWQELVKKDDLRFFKHSRNVVDELKKHKANGVILKLCHWNLPNLHNDYMLSKKIKHINFAKYICYFEYEEDIIHCLMNNSEAEDVYDDNAVVILPMYSSKVKDAIKHFIKDTNDIILQIILSLYYALYCHNITFIGICIDNIYIDVTQKMTTLKYEFSGFKHKIQTRQIVKLDIFRNAQETSEIKPQHYRQLYNNILQILKELNASSELIDFIQGFVSHQNDEKIVCPMKVIDSIICNVGM